MPPTKKTPAQRSPRKRTPDSGYHPRLTKAQWHLLVESYTQYATHKRPGHAEVSKATGLPHNMCVRAWSRSLPYIGVPSIRETLRLAQVKLRAEIGAEAPTGLPVDETTDMSPGEPRRVHTETDTHTVPTAPTNQVAPTPTTHTDSTELTHNPTAPQAVQGPSLADMKAKEREEELDALAEGRRLEMEKAAAHAAQTRGAEGRMVTATRTNVILLQGTISRLMRGALSRADEVEAHVRERMSPGALVRFVSECGKLLHEANSAAKLAMDMERVLMGEPTEIIGINAHAMSQEDAVRTLALARKTYERLQGKATTDTIIDAPQGSPGALPADAGRVSQPED